MAGRFSVEAVFKAVDRVTAPVSKMQNRIGKFTRGVTRGLRSTNRAMQNFSGTMTSGLKNFAAVSAVAMGSAAAAIVSTTGRLDELAKRGRRLEFPIEALQEWQFVAEQSGLSIEEFDRSLEKFAKTLGEAKAGTGALTTFLKKSNPELLKQIESTTNIADALDLYISAIDSAPDAMSRAALATAAFGRSGSKMINIAENGTDAIAALRREQRENGVVTANQAAQAEKFNDALNSLKRAGVGFLQSAVVPLLPKLTELLATWRALAVANRELVSRKVTEYFLLLKNNLPEIVAWIKKAAIGVGIFVALNAALQAVAATLVIVNALAAMNPIGLMVIAVAGAVTGLVMLIKNLDEIIEKFEDMPVILRLWLAPFEIVLRALKGIRDATISAAEALGIIDNRDSHLLGKKRPVESDEVIAERRAERLMSAERGRRQMISPHGRGTHSSSTAEVTIKDETGRAAVTAGKLGGGLKLTPAGVF